MYRLKHKPTGLYYQPGDNNLSTRGKVYQTNTHGLSEKIKFSERFPTEEKYQYFTVTLKKNSKVAKHIMECKGLCLSESRLRLRVETNLSDWEKEYL